MAGPLLVAGVGNLFLSDDGFGPEAARRYAETPPPKHVRVVDYGIRGMHLAYDLLDGYAALVLLDALPGDGPAGELTVLQIGADDVETAGFDAHGMDPAAVLGSLEALGGTPPPTYLVGCRPASTAQGIGLSPPVEAAVPAAVQTVTALVARLSRAGVVDVGRG